MLAGFHHLGIVVKNLDRSIRFYRDVLGLEPATEVSPWRTGIRGARLRHVCLKLNDTILELLEFENGEVIPGDYATGVPHFAFRVANLEQSKQRLEAKGITFLSEINTVTEGILTGWRWTCFNDPDGYTVELVELVATLD